MSQQHGSTERPPLDVAQIFANKSILLIGATGFVGKVALSMLLRYYPSVGRVYALVRPGMGDSASERFFAKVAASPAFDPLREVWGDGYQSFLREKVVPIPGDIGRPMCNFGEPELAAFRATGLDLIINSAGLVSFTPPLESAIRINALGAQHVLDVARATGARLVHISTCYVAGRRDGNVWEDEPAIGYFPRADEINTEDFSAADEIADCQRMIEQVREMANDRAHISQFRELAAKDLLNQRRDPDNEQNLRLGVARERKLWVNKQLTELGQERAEHWGWTNTYTYTKSLGEQVILADKEVISTIVRPAIVESAMRYPFPGWNEGFNTTAPLVYLVLKGHRQIVAGHRTPLDIIPVDMVCAGMLQAGAAVLSGRHKPVYQCGTSDVNPVFTSRLTELTALAVRRHRNRLADEGEDVIENRIRARLQAFPVTYDRYQALSAPKFKRVAERLQDEIDRRLPRWGAPRLAAVAERAKERLSRVSEFSGQVNDLIELFKPFAHDHDIRFRCDNTRALNAELTPHDRQILRWDPETIDWRAYWFDQHFPGLLKWVFPVLDDEFGPKPRSVYTYKDLVELFEAATKLNKHRVALRLLPKPDSQDSEPEVYTYARVQNLAEQGASQLRERGIAAGDRVMLMSENRPEWGISYFAIIKAGATVVPLDSQLSLAEVKKLLTASGAKLAVISAKVAERLLDDAGMPVPMARTEESGRPGSAGRNGARDAHDSGIDEDALLGLCGQALGGLVIGFADLFSEPAAPARAAAPLRLGESVASLIYTSGTTGDPKGVMLTHKNLTAMTSRLSSLFRLYRHDGLLSVLPLHHTLEFSAGFLMPLVHGSSITYLEEITADSLSDAFAEGHITGLVGVPALWQLLHRKIFQVVQDRGILLERLFENIVELSRALWRKTGISVGKLLFFPVHMKLGGRLRLLISGGSALPQDIMKSFHGLGFRLYEGYGLTESSPVLTVMRPGDAPVLGSVGRALPSVDVKIFEPDERGVGEVIAKGPTIMAGYYQNQEATAAVLRDGWLYTGDLGRLDEEGNLYIVGRKKEMILGTAGENIYPDELEDIYKDSPYIKELSIVGLPAEGTGETVAALIVPNYDQEGLSRETVRERVREHIRSVSKQLPLYKRIKTFHLWDFDLPRTSTRKVKRREVVSELVRLQSAAAGATEAKRLATTSAGSGAEWVRDVIAQVSHKNRSQVAPDTRLDELGFDSLMLSELVAALEATGAQIADPSDLNDLETVGDVEAYLAREGRSERGAGRTKLLPTRKDKDKDKDASDDIHVPESMARVGRRILRMGQRATYDRVFHTKVEGRAYIPPVGGYIVAANHASHLDMGLVKHALGEHGDLLVTLAAKDYFFDDPVRRAYFENFTNLVPMERYGSLRESLRLASEVLRSGHILLIFPEGTRSDNGVMTEFKPSLGYLALTNRCGILPMYLGGTHDALPKGAYLPKNRSLLARIGPYADYPKLATLAEGATRNESYRVVSQEMERVVRKLTPEGYAWTLGDAGREALATWQAAQAAGLGPGPGKDAGSSHHDAHAEEEQP